MRVLLDRGFAEPVSRSRANADPVDIVVPVLDDVDGLRRLLSTMPLDRVVVVDDGSTDPERIASIARGARIVRHLVNRGPAAARNTGLAHSDTSLVAFIDADCVGDDTWPTALLGNFDDPGVGAVAPRIVPDDTGRNLLSRYESVRSSLDMGDRPALVRAGARLGFVPSAALIVRRAALPSTAFDEELRVGEDVDLIWRLADAGWLVRYDPSVVVRHRSRTRLQPWLRRKFQYGTSAADLEARHPGNLAPARPSLWSLVTLASVAAGHPLVGVAVQAVPFAQLRWAFRRVPDSDGLALRVAAQGLFNDAVGIGQALRREWWPIGMVTLIASPWSRSARVGAVVMTAPVMIEWAKTRPPMNPLAYLALRLLDDAAYGTGVLASSFTAKTWKPLAPDVRVPKAGRVSVAAEFLQALALRLRREQQ